jgi:hypothetical protein
MWSVESSLELAVAPEQAWPFYADPAMWSRWAHSTAWAATDDRPLRVRSLIRVKPTRGPVQRVRVARLEAERHLTTELRLPGARMTFDYELGPVAAGCRVRHRISMAGPLSSAYGFVLRTRNARKLREETARLGKVIAAAAATAKREPEGAPPEPEGDARA